MSIKHNSTPNFSGEYGENVKKLVDIKKKLQINSTETFQIILYLCLVLSGCVKGSRQLRIIFPGGANLINP